MKKLIVATIMLCASTSQAADWSPVFKRWGGDGGSNFCSREQQHPVVKAVYEASSDDLPYYDFGVALLETVLSPEGQLGNYSTVPMPYRQDLLPAVHLDRRYKNDGSQVLTDKPSGVYIPLQNARFYNLPLQGIAFYDWEIAWYYALHFGKYSKVKEQQLKKAIKGGGTWIARTEHNELIWVCEMT